MTASASLKPSAAEATRLHQVGTGEHDWQLWGPYLAERQWGTVREDYSDDGETWSHFTHDHARSRAYRWGEDGLLGLTDRGARLCFGLGLWNGRDPILKERLFGLSGIEGNHAEDVKELYHYLQATPTYSYLSVLYKYPHAAYPYVQLLEENRRRSKLDPEFEIEETGVFDGGHYSDIGVEYAKLAPDDILIRISCHNRSTDAAVLHVLPTLWLRNTWAWGRTGNGYAPEGQIQLAAPCVLSADHPSLGRYELSWLGAPTQPVALFTNNETNHERLFNFSGGARYTKDAFHRWLIDGEAGAVNPEQRGTKACFCQRLELAGSSSQVLRLRLATPARRQASSYDVERCDATFERRKQEADEYHLERRSALLNPEERRVVMQADAGLLCSRQFYHYIVKDWLEGDPAQPRPPAGHSTLRNREWQHVWASDLISMPDKWEFPWFAAWDLAFHAVAMARIDPYFAKQQVLLLGDGRYMHPVGQLPAYEYSFGDANPPLLAWSAWRVYQLTAQQEGGKDREFLERAFHHALLNFSWWINRKDVGNNHLFSGGFLGLDNIGVFDRSQPLPGGGLLEQADATAWMAFYATTLLAMSLELCRHDMAYADMAAKFFEQFLAIAEAMNAFGGHGLWDERDGFYYDCALLDGREELLRVRSMVGLIPLLAAETLDARLLARLPQIRERLLWVFQNRPHLTRNIALLHPDSSRERQLLAVPPSDRLVRVLRYMLDEAEFLSPYGIRSLSRYHAEHPFQLACDGVIHNVRYAPGPSETGLFGGNSNWRGPIWLPMNYLLIEALKRHHHFYGKTLQVECPVGSGQFMTLLGVAEELERRLSRLFLGSGSQTAPWRGKDPRLAGDPHSAELLLFHEYFNGDTGEGLGASHQTGWTALIANVMERVAMARERH